mmetsp:Transcript_11385/g.29151  ORF Transcript_11385/g.29151 Transcript_11385/m.29151 type:complete len:206 (-) Transcript_11385:203-820(-)
MAVTVNHIFMRFQPLPREKLDGLQRREHLELDSPCPREPRPYLSPQAHTWFYHDGQGSALPSLMSNDASSTTGSSVPQYARPTFFSGMGQPDAKWRNSMLAANSLRPRTTAPRYGWASELRPLTKSQRSVSDEERRLPCWKDCPPPPPKPPPPLRRNPIHGVTYEELNDYASPEMYITTSMDYSLHAPATAAARTPTTPLFPYRP